MWHARCHTHLSTYFAFDQYLLSAVIEEVFHPLQSTTPYSIVLDLEEKKSMRDLIKGLGEVQEDEVSLCLILNASSQIVDGQI